MGLAASQAQLLTMTSRITNNELRAQMIDEEKKRLATSSSEASARYMQALDDSQMMITNFGTNGKKQTQELTFNALTAYNQYNNQYGLVSAEGLLLISEAEDKNFQIAINASDPLSKFLELHGLKYDTTFFDGLPKDAHGNATYMGYTEDGEYAALSIGHTPEELKVMYLGGIYKNAQGVETYHKGYAQAQETMNWKQYEKLLNNYYAAFDNFEAAVWPEIKADVKSHTDRWVALEKQDASGLQLYTAMKNSVTQMSSKGYDDYFDMVLGDMNKFENIYAEREKTRSSSITQGANADEIIISFGNQEYTVKRTGNNYSITKFMSTNGEGVTTQVPITSQTRKDTALSSPNIGLEFVVDGGTDKQRLIIPEWVNGTVPTEAFWQDTTPISDEEYRQFYDSGRDVLAANVGYHYGLDPMVGTDPDIKAAQKAFHEAAASLSAFLKSDFKANADYGLDPAMLGAANELARYDLDDLDFMIAHYGTNARENFKVVYNVEILDRLFNTHSEPKMAWVDANSKENADNKVQWYTNLFNRMKEGRKVIEDGLASSADWIKFQIQNGIVTMEQADFEGNWKTFITTNNKDITEQDNSLAIVLAEADYNREINKIQNKDKRMDLELKNLDTEHSALQNEYNSIQAAMDKNIQRVFKYYSA